MSTKENCKKANIIRTKLLLLIANEQSAKKKIIDKNVMRLNRKSVEEINEMVREAETDIAAGRCCTAEEGWKKLEEEFPWLKD